MTKKHHEQKAWVPLVDADVRPFDQTNGAVDFDPGAQHDGRNDEADLMSKGVASNIVNAGFFGGGGI